MVQQLEAQQYEITRGGLSDVDDASSITLTMGIIVPLIPEGTLTPHMDGFHQPWAQPWIHGILLQHQAPLALTDINLLTDEKFRHRVRANIGERTEGFTHKSPIP